MAAAASANVAPMSTPHPPDPGSGEGANGDSSGAGSAHGSEAELLARYGITRLLAPNPGPFTLSGTNTWLLARDPTWVIDPGPLEDSHLERLIAAIDERGGLGGVALTHDHGDHAAAVPVLLAERPAPLAAGRGMVDVRLDNEVRFGPFVAVATPGHAVDHYALVARGACFTGDAVLGEGSVFISPYRGAMSAYMLALTRLRMRDDFNVLCPGHGPPVWDARARVEEYLAHRVDREHELIAALSEGRRTIAEMLAAVWPDVPEQLLPLATATLAAHLDKLEDEQILPEDVERPKFERTEW
jgi:glyoxylase-like metal-dependent hydrolase (beta-lactamase superfamily II)